MAKHRDNPTDFSKINLKAGVLINECIKSGLEEIKDKWALIYTGSNKTIIFHPTMMLLYNESGLIGKYFYKTDYKAAMPALKDLLSK